MVNRTKISLFIPSLAGGGAERVFINLAHEFVSFGYDVDLIVCNKTGELSTGVKNISIVDLKSSSVFKSVFPLFKHLRQSEPKFLFAAMPHANIAAVISCLFSKIKVIITIHEDVFKRYENSNFKNKVILKLSKLIYPFAFALIAVSKGVLESERRFLKRSIPKNNCVIYNPILDKNFPVSKNLNIYKPKSQTDPFRIVSVGRLTHQKDYLTLLKAIKLTSSSINLSLDIYGNGELENELKKYCVDNEISDIVSFKGFSSDLSEIYSDKDIFILSSRWEGFGNVIVEAIAFGCIVISTNCNHGPAEILENGKYGYLFDVGDPEQLSKILCSIFEGSIIKYDISEAISLYNATSVSKQYLQLTNLDANNK